jgi:hypothetical protein
MKISYLPLLKTTEAELKAYLNLDDKVKDNVLTIFELTKSRTTKKNQNGDIFIKIDKLKDLIEDRYYILDLTTEVKLSNAQIVEMLTVRQNGFEKWCDFIRQMNNDKLIPVIHFVDDDTDKNITNQIKNLENISKYLCFRGDLFDVNLLDQIKVVLNAIRGNEKLILVIDAKFVEVKEINQVVDAFDKIISQIPSSKKIKIIAPLMSGFPASVISSGYGGNEYGDFKIAEVDVSKNLISKLNSKNITNVFYSDFGSVHPFRYDTMATRWVPRIDYPLDDTFYYYRYRRDKGSYIKAAKKIISDTKYNKISSLSCWGEDEIEDASKGAPNGASPAYWISVRINLYITRQYIRLSKNAKSFSL